MRLVLTGATGFAGSAVLDQLLTWPGVDAIMTLTRRPLDREDDRITSVVIGDFEQYDPRLLATLGEYDACIWALGAKSSDVSDPSAYSRVTHDYTLALARGLAENNHDRFVFCYLSGMGATANPSTRLPWERATRLAKGQTEYDLRALARDHAGFHTVSFRPGGILPADTSRLLVSALSPITVTVTELAQALIGVALGTAPGAPDVIHNSAIRRLSRIGPGAPGASS